MLGIVFEEGNYGLVLEYVLYWAMDQFFKDIRDLRGHNDYNFYIIII